MFSLFGAPALSQFRLDRLLRTLKTLDSRVTTLGSRWVHFVDASRNLSGPELKLLKTLLTYGTRVADTSDIPDSPAASAGTIRILVTPRVGTESPWSSKATDK